MKQDNVVPIRRRGRPLTPVGHQDEVSLRLIDAQCRIQALAAAEREHALERVRVLRALADDFRAIDWHRRQESGAAA